MTKDERQGRIRFIVSQHEVETQEELVHYLEDEGALVTQATISRDIKDLQLIKVMGSHGRYKYAVPTAPPTHDLASVRERLRPIFLSLARAQNLLVVKVLPGHAHSIAWLFDNVTVPGLLGTIAGDDTILLILADETAALNMQQQIQP